MTKRSAWIFAFGWALLAASSTPAEDIAKTLSLPVASGLVGARDKARLAWVENEAGVRNIWIADKGGSARRLTAFGEDDGIEIYDLAFAHDGNALAFVRGGDAEYPDMEDLPNPAALASWPKQQLFVSALDGAPLLIGEGHSPAFSPDGRSLAFTYRGSIYLWQRGQEAHRIAKVAGEVGNLQWAPDGASLVFADNRGNHSLIGLFAIGASEVRYFQPELGFSDEPVFSPDGKRIAFVFFVDPPAGAPPDSGPYWSLRIADLATGETRTLWSAPPGEGARWAGTRGQNLLWSADGKIVFPWEASGWIHAYAIDAEGGAPHELTPGAFELDTYRLSPDGKALIYAVNSAADTDRHHLWRVSLEGGARVPLTKGTGVESYPVFAADTLAATATDATHPAYPALVGRTLTPIGPSPAARDFAAPEPVVFKAEDGVTIHAQLLRAKGPGKHPALVFVHGGPRRQMLLGFHPSGYYSNAYILNQHFAAEGYDVLSVNYRSGTGYGRAFRDAPGIAREGAAEYRDVVAAGRWLASQADVDPKRIGIWGGSWGGYLTALALARNSDLFAAGVDLHGVHAMVRPVDNNLSPDAQATARQLQWQSSPMASIDRWRSPVLLIHGDDDKNVDFGQSLLLARELAARRIPYRDLILPNERHSFLRYADWLTSYRAADKFLGNILLAPSDGR